MGLLDDVGPTDPEPLVIGQDELVAASGHLGQYLGRVRPMVEQAAGDDPVVEHPYSHDHFGIKR